MKTGSTRLSLSTAADLLIYTQRSEAFEARCHHIAAAAIAMYGVNIYGDGKLDDEKVNELAEFLANDHYDYMLMRCTPGSLILNNERLTWYWDQKEKALNSWADQHSIKII